jgi:Uma2 family endonuclease
MVVEVQQAKAEYLNEPRQQPDHPVTYEEFLKWADGSFAEWVDGEVIFTSPISLSHNDISVFLTRLLTEFVEVHDLGRVLAAPFQMKLSNVRRGREPDLMFVAKTHLARLTRTYLDGPADLAIEIVSPESVARDRSDKFSEYETEGVCEYWIIDPEAQSADFFVLNDEGRYTRMRLDDTGIYRSTVLDGLWINVNWLWQQPLPPLRQVLRELGLG